MRGARRDLERAVVARSVHRASWRRDSIAVAVALLSGLLAVRVGANVLMSIDISLRGGLVQWRQSAMVHCVVFVAFSAWTSVRRLVVIDANTGQVPWLASSQVRRRFVRRCSVRALLASPGLIVPAAAGFSLIVASQVMAGPGRPAPATIAEPVLAVLLFAAVLLASTAMAPVLARKLRVSGEQLEVVHLVGLILLYAANPDVVPAAGGVLTSLFMQPVHLGHGAAVGLALAAGALPSVAVTVTAVLDRLGRRVSGRIPRSALLLWYSRTSAAPWLLALAVVLPVAFSGNLRSLGRTWITVAVVVTATGWLIGILGRIDQLLSLRWNKPVLRRYMWRQLLPVVSVHAALTVLAALPALLR